ncbi:hypothetical protein B566_EDAN018827, partial [Ephemera danica]
MADDHAYQAISAYSTKLTQTPNIDRIASEGALAALGGLIITARLDSAQPNAGTGYELDAIAAVVIGGTSLTGGR